MLTKLLGKMEKQKSVFQVFRFSLLSLPFQFAFLGGKGEVDILLYNTLFLNKSHIHCE